jgi:hypothetical protein
MPIIDPKIGDQFVTTKELIAAYIKQPPRTTGNPKTTGTITMQIYEADPVPTGSTVVMVGKEDWPFCELWDVTLPGRKRKRFKNVHLSNWRQYRDCLKPKQE